MSALWRGIPSACMPRPQGLLSQRGTTRLLPPPCSAPACVASRWAAGGTSARRSATPASAAPARWPAPRPARAASRCCPTLRATWLCRRAARPAASCSAAGRTAATRGARSWAGTGAGLAVRPRARRGTHVGVHGDAPRQKGWRAQHGCAQHGCAQLALPFPPAGATQGPAPRCAARRWRRAASAARRSAPCRWAAQRRIVAGHPSSHTPMRCGLPAHVKRRPAMQGARPSSAALRRAWQALCSSS